MRDTRNDDGADRQANAGGLYSPNRFLIKLEPGVRYPGRNAHEDAIFAHEYWHYLQNVTTPAGVDSLRVDQALIALFSKTMAPLGDGSSRGRSALSAPDAELTARLLARKRSVAGERGPSQRLGDRELTARAVEVTEAKVTFAIEKRGFALDPVSMTVGSIAIEESIARAIEERSVLLENEVPEHLSDFPYRVVDRIVALRAPKVATTSLAAAALGTLALLTDQPGRHLPRLADRFGQHRVMGHSELKSLEILAGEEREAVQAICRHFIDLAAQLNALHAGRGMLDGAMRLVCADYTRGLQRRIDDPLFDIGPLLAAADNADQFDAHMHRLFEEFPPCDVMRTTDTDTGPRREIISFRHGQDENGFDQSQYFRSLQSQNEHMLVHALSDLPETAALGPVRCTFFDACNHPLKQSDPATCEEAPWRHVRKDEPGCWYTSGVAATIGIVRARKVTETEK